MIIVYKSYQYISEINAKKIHCTTETSKSLYMEFQTLYNMLQNKKR